MEVPAGVEIIGVEPGADFVGLAFGETDEAGNFETTVGAITKVYVLLRGEVTWNGTPVLESFGNPIPAGVYSIKATGLNSGTTAMTTIEFTYPESE
jgi:hypothetical protein